MSQSDELQIATIASVKRILEPLLNKLDSLEQIIKNQGFNKPTNKYYRNIELKKMYGLSNNTIIKYRDNGLLPYTTMGDIYLYDAQSIEKMLEENRVE